MITAVDSNILIDIFSNDKNFEEKSENALRRCLREGSLCACEIVWTETALAFLNRVSFINAMEILGIEFSPMQLESTLIAAHGWRQYRTTGGKREKVAPDFLIGAHALTQCDRLLTRDNGFYRTYFSSLKIITP